MRDWYEQQRRHIYEDIVERLELDSDKEEAGGVFNLLLSFLTEHRDDEDLLCNFLRYTTGSPNARWGQHQSRHQHCTHIAHTYTAVTRQTCFLTIRLPVIPDEREAEEAFLVQLLDRTWLLEERRSSERWTFNGG